MSYYATYVLICCKRLCHLILLFQLIKHSVLTCQSTVDYTTTTTISTVLINMFIMMLSVLITIRSLILDLIATSVLHKLLTDCLLRYVNFLLHRFNKRILIILLHEFHPIKHNSKTASGLQVQKLSLLYPWG